MYTCRDIYVIFAFSVLLWCIAIQFKSKEQSLSIKKSRLCTVVSTLNALRRTLKGDADWDVIVLGFGFGVTTLAEIGAVLATFFKVRSRHDRW